MLQCAGVAKGAGRRVARGAGVIICVKMGLLAQDCNCD